MRVICAPDSFKGSMSAATAAEAMAAGIQKAVPDAIIDCCPIADGGEGTLDALTTAMPGDLQRLMVSGPLGDTVEEFSCGRRISSGRGSAAGPGRLS
jgi:glycerate kinase